MATYTELFTLQTDTPLLQRVSTAVLVASVAIYEESTSTLNHDRRVLWAKMVTKNLPVEANAILLFLLGKFNTMTVAGIQNSTDAQIQTAVNNAVNLFAVGF